MIIVRNKCAVGLGERGGGWQNGDVFVLNQAVHAVGSEI